MLFLISCFSHVMMKYAGYIIYSYCLFAVTNDYSVNYKQENFTMISMSHAMFPPGPTHYMYSPNYLHFPPYIFYYYVCFLILFIFSLFRCYMHIHKSKFFYHFETLNSIIIYREYQILLIKLISTQIFCYKKYCIFF